MAVVDEAPLSVVIAGGGTGGHIVPAIALAKALTKHAADVRIVGRQGGPEATTVRAQGIAFEGIDVLGFRRSVSPRNVLAAAKGALATGRAVGILRRARADVAVGTGGYVSIPVAMAAAMLRIPLVLHEANAIPGVANRLAGRWAAAVAVSFPGAERWFRAPVTMTGNPIRPEVATLDRFAHRTEAYDHFGLEASRRTLLVFGGSQGARRINEAALGAYERWRGDERLQVLHLVGPKELPGAEARLEDLRLPEDRVLWRLVGSTDRMDLAYSVADLALCRAGAATLFEIASAALPAIVVPYPYATADHQRANAQPLVDSKAVVLLLDADCTAGSVGELVDDLLWDESRLGAMSASIHEFARPQAAESLADVVRAAARR
ncbi:MAG: UDP-N-acetylglucosamine--N-acetylmuramyl-(pentapeptide) pyrophosphoryl-undecaprenol [Actinobacteria bacterium]|nr:UDP-N-acetylglucosamine--N-acetylmuramyl-(pentapeptide) pyrophosphoryl-undecaprenol [Actinomycetota bacterium]